MSLTLHLRAADGATHDLVVPSVQVQSGLTMQQVMTGAGPNPSKTLTAVPGQATSGTGWHWDSANNSIRIDTAGVTLTGLDIAGGVVNQINTGTPFNATDCRFRLTGWADGSVGVPLPPGCTLTRCEIGGGADGQTWVRSLLLSAYGTAANPIVLDHCHIHHGLHGVHHGGYFTCKYSWIHDESMGQSYNGGATPNPNDHSDGFFWDHGHFVTIQHNVIAGGNQAGFFGQNYAHTADGSGDIVIDSNWFLTDLTRQGQPYGGPPNYGLDIENKMINGPITITNNTFDKGPWGQGCAAVPQDGSNGQKIIVSGNQFMDGTSADSSIARTPVIY